MVSGVVGGDKRVNVISERRGGYVQRPYFMDFQRLSIGLQNQQTSYGTTLAGDASPNLVTRNRPHFTLSIDPVAHDTYSPTGGTHLI